MTRTSCNCEPRNPVQTVKIDTLLLANYGIFQPTTGEDGMTVFLPLDDEDRRDLMEFAQFLMAEERAFDFDDLDEVDEDERLRDEP